MKTETLRVLDNNQVQVLDGAAGGGWWTITTGFTTITRPSTSTETGY